MLYPSSSNQEENKDTLKSVFSEIPFPEIIDEKIRTVEFLTATRGIIRILDKLGKIFAPLKYDIQGNIDMLTAKYEANKEKNTILQDMIIIEKTTETNLIAMNALIWLTRELNMFLLFFEKIVEDTKTSTPTEDLVAFFQQSYYATLEPHHEYMARQLFVGVSRRVHTRSQLLQVLSNKQAVKNGIVINHIEIYLMNLRRNVSVINTFLKVIAL